MASKINADEFVDREGEGKPTLPKGVVLSGVTTITTAVVAGNEVANSTGINAGIITSTHFSGNLTGDINAGIVTVSSQTVVGSGITISASGIHATGVISATSYVGSGANLTGLGATIMVWEYNPDPYVDEIAVDTGIGITFNQKIKAGSGNITLRIAGAAGTVVENFGVGSSVTISNNSLSFTPTSDLDQNVTYFVDIPSSSLTNMAGDSYVGTGYTFQTTYILEQMWAIGKNQYGQLGQNQAAAQLDGLSSPTQIPGATWKTFRRSSNGADIAAIKTDGTLWTWGSNNYGQLGQNIQGDNLSSPTQVPGTWTPFNNSQNAFSGGGCNKIVKTDGTLWTWGNSFYGALGHNDNVKRSSPVQVGSDTTWSSVVGDRISTLALKTDGTLWSFGQNEYGELGLNNKTDRSSPTQIPGTTWAILGRSQGTSQGAIKTDGTLWVWGRNQTGVLGLNNQTEYSSPKQIPGTTWANIAFSEQIQAMATKTDGTLWMWGSGGFGGTGQNNQTQYSSPKQIPGTTWDTENFKTTNYHSHALKTDGTLWSWGYNNDGNLGQNNRTVYSSPIQVGSNTNWKQLGGTGHISLLGAHVPSST